jgi:hypothetical protein
MKLYALSRLSCAAFSLNEETSILKQMKRILVDPTSNIRSSQRLSHACLSTYLTKVKPQKAQYNSCNFLDHIPSTWITVENLELIHALMRVLLWFSCSY